MLFLNKEHVAGIILFRALFGHLERFVSGQAWLAAIIARPHTRKIRPHNGSAGTKKSTLSAIEHVHSSVILTSPPPFCAIRLKLKLLIDSTYHAMHTQQGKRSPLCAVPSLITHSQHKPHHHSTDIHLTYYPTCEQISRRRSAAFLLPLRNELPCDLCCLSSIHSFRQKLMVYLDSL